MVASLSFVRMGGLFHRQTVAVGVAAVGVLLERQSWAVQLFCDRRTLTEHVSAKGKKV